MNRHRTAWQGALPAFLLLLFLALIFLSIRQSGSQEKEMTEEIPLQPQPQVEEAPSVPRQGEPVCWDELLAFPMPFQAGPADAQRGLYPGG